MTPGPDGTLQGSLPVVAPPKPCPCVVLITDLSSAYVSRVPVDVVGVPSEAVASVAPATRPLTVKVEASVSGGTSLASVLGGAAHRFVNVTVTNTGPVAIMPVVIARWGRGSAPHRVIGSPSPVALAPGETRTVHMPLRLDPLSFGGYRVTGSVAGGARTVPFSTSASTWPWGLLLVGQAVLVAARNAVRRHLERQEAKERRAARRAGRRGARVAT
jgi:hypothetical protein